MRRANDGAEVVGIFHSVQDDEQLRSIEDVIQFDVIVHDAKSDNALMRDALTETIERISWFETNGNAALPTELDDLLNPRPGRAFRDQNLVERAMRAQRLANRVNTEQVPAHKLNATR
jgi:hypothetical protein